MDTTNKGSQPQMILCHFTTVQKVMFLGLKCGAINLHTRTAMTLSYVM